LIDKVFIISLEKDKPRRDRLLSLIKSESDKSLIEKTSLIKGVHHAQINEKFLSDNNFDYYKDWVLTEAQCDEIASQYPNEEGHSIGRSPCERFYRTPLKNGQICCLIGHIQCWRQIVHKGYDSALILEDDSWWTGCLSSELEYLKNLKLQENNIDFCFLGREPHLDRLESDWAVDPKYVIPNYSYNSHSYILTYQGAIKLLSQEPHKKLMSADEFLGASYCYHPRSDLRDLIKTNLNAIAVNYPSDERSGNQLIYQATGYETGHEGISHTNI